MAKTDQKVDSGIDLGDKTKAMIGELQQWAGAGDNGRSPGQIAMDIVEQILTAETLEEAAGGTADLPLNIPLTINVKAWQPSDLGVFGVFAVLECVDGFDLENKKTVTCGGANVVALLYRAQKENKLPLKGQFLEVDTQSGFTTYKLDLLPE